MTKSRYVWKPGDIEVVRGPAKRKAAVEADVQQVEGPSLPDVPPTFGDEIRDDLRRLAHGPQTEGELALLHHKIGAAPAPDVTKTADELAAGMLEATMRALAEKRKGRSE